MKRRRRKYWNDESKFQHLTTKAPIAVNDDNITVVHSRLSSRRDNKQALSLAQTDRTHYVHNTLTDPTIHTQSNTYMRSPCTSLDQRAIQIRSTYRS